MNDTQRPRVLVTGAAGFIGTHLSRELTSAEYDVVRVDREHDLRVLGVAERLVERHEPDIVVHLAAKVGRLFGEDDPGMTIADNATMTTLVAKACNGARLVYASTSEVYGDQGDTVCHEDGPLALPHNLYGLSKRWGEETCGLYAPDRLTILRLSMPYGPGLPAGRGRAAIVNFLDQARQRKPISVHRGAERSWAWIGDVCRAIRLIIERSDGGIFNVGRDDDPRPMTDVARIACNLTGAPYSLIEEINPPRMQTVVKRLSTEKIRALGWEPRVPLADGMRRTLAAIS